MAKSRTKNVSINAIFGVTYQVTFLVLTFIARRIFVKVLGEEFLGINGLYTNILSILSLAELGFSSAIVAHLYKPIAEKNYEKIKAYMRLYRNVYISIGIFVLVSSGIIMPFLEYFINGEVTIDINIYLIFVLFVLNSASSYFFSYRTSLINAHQKKYVVDIIKTTIIIIKEVSLILVLYLTHNYYIYMIVTVVSTIVTYAIVYGFSNIMFPYLKDNKIDKLDKHEIRSVYVSVSALIIYRIAWSLLGSTTNIFVSTFVGLAEVGLLSNYLLICNNANSLISSFTTGLTSSIGEFNVSKPLVEQEKLFNSIFLITYWIGSFFAVSVFLFMNNVIYYWLDEGKYIMEWYVAFAVVLNMYVICLAYPTNSIRVTKNLFKYNKIAPALSIFLNVGLSFLLGYFLNLGIFGYLIALPITRLLSFGTIDPYITYKYGFEMRPTKYYIKYVASFFSTAIICGITYFAINIIPCTSIWHLALQMIISVIVSNTLILLSVCWTKEFKIVFNKAIHAISHIVAIVFKRNKSNKAVIME